MPASFALDPHVEPPYIQQFYVEWHGTDTELSDTFWPHTVFYRHVRPDIHSRWELQDADNNVIWETKAPCGGTSLTVMQPTGTPTNYDIKSRFVVLENNIKCTKHKCVTEDGKTTLTAITRSNRRYDHPYYVRIYRAAGEDGLRYLSVMLTLRSKPLLKTLCALSYMALGCASCISH